jgi:hypothetical protein
MTARARTKKKSLIQYYCSPILLLLEQLTERKTR